MICFFIPPPFVHKSPQIETSAAITDLRPSSPDLRRQVALVLDHLGRAQPLLTSPAVVTSPLPPAPSLLDTLALTTSTCGDPGTWLLDTLQIR